MLQTAMKWLTAESREKREAAELFLRFALYEQSNHPFGDTEELQHMDFRIVAKELTGSESFTALAAYFKGNDTIWTD